MGCSGRTSTRRYRSSIATCSRPLPYRATAIRVQSATRCSKREQSGWSTWRASTWTGSMPVSTVARPLSGALLGNVTFWCRIVTRRISTYPLPPEWFCWWAGCCGYCYIPVSRMCFCVRGVCSFYQRYVLHVILITRHTSDVEEQFNLMVMPRLIICFHQSTMVDIFWEMALNGVSWFEV